VARVRNGTGRSACRFAQSCSSRCVSGATLTQSHIPKADGRQRRSGIGSLEDKVVQQAVVTVLNEIYEADFRGFRMRTGRDATRTRRWMRSMRSCKRSL